jgi:hypothetical protein
VKYIGVTGINQRVSTSFLRDAVALMPNGYRFMAGVLVSRKTFRSEPTTNRRKCTLEYLPSTIRRCRNVGAWPVIHYNVEQGSSLLEQFSEIGNAWHGPLENCSVQLNGFFEKPEVLQALKRRYPVSEVILQLPVGSEFLGESPTCSDILDVASRYEGIADHFLLDFSCGQGKPLDEDLVRGVCSRWEVQGHLGVAGGLDEESVARLEGLHVSVDAESRLRSELDELVEQKALEYVRLAADVLKVVPDHASLKLFSPRRLHSSHDKEVLLGLENVAAQLVERCPPSRELDAALNQLLVAHDAVHRALASRR